MEKGKLTISKVTSNIRDDYIKIEVYHYKHILHVEVDPKEFALTLTGLGGVPCEFRMFKKDIGSAERNSPKGERQPS